MSTPPVAFLILTSILFNPNSEFFNRTLIVVIFVAWLGYLIVIPVGVPITWFPFSAESTLYILTSSPGISLI